LISNSSEKQQLSKKKLQLTDPLRKLACENSTYPLVRDKLAFLLHKNINIRLATQMKKLQRSEE